MPRIIITGAAGLVGLNLISMLPAKRYRIVAVDNSPRVSIIARLFPHVKVIREDIAQDGHWQDELGQTDIVISLQAQISAAHSDPYYRNNVSAVKRLLEACKKHDVKHIIHMSSSVVISVSDDLYVKTKTQGERLIAKSSVPHTIIRPSLLYGVFDYKHLGYITNVMEKSPIIPIPGDGSYIRQPLYVMDLCRIIHQCIQRPASGKTHNVIGKEKIPFREMLQRIAHARRMRRMFVSTPQSMFAMMLRTYTKIFRKAPFVPDQMRALTAGDVFPVDDWEEEFGVEHTPFNKALNEIVHSQYKDYRSGHIEK